MNDGIEYDGIVFMFKRSLVMMWFALCFIAVAVGCFLIRMEVMSELNPFCNSVWEGCFFSSFLFFFCFWGWVRG